MRGYTSLIRGVTWQEAAFFSAEPERTRFMALAMDCYHDAARDEDERRARRDRPDSRHLTYL
jgi:hypothetical protein